VLTKNPEVTGLGDGFFWRFGYVIGVGVALFRFQDFGQQLAIFKPWGQVVLL
jgi:hypothetical protein